MRYGDMTTRPTCHDDEEEERERERGEKKKRKELENYLVSRRAAGIMSALGGAAAGQGKRSLLWRFLRVL